MKNQIFLVDNQVDFCDPSGALFVKGADEDSKRIAKFIRKMGDTIDSISATLDSHRVIQIFHPIYWIDSKGNNPSPFTAITENDVVGKNARWKAANPAWQERSVEYVKALTKFGRSVLIIWPFHCLISTKGHNMMPEVSEALIDWEKKYFAMVSYETKGPNPFTEMYSVFQADVPDPNDPSTQLNTNLVQRLQEADNIYIAGQALSHCVNWSVTDCANQFGDEHVKKFILLEDCSSPVGDQPGSTMFRDMADKFVSDMKKRGMRIAKSTDF